MNIKLAPGRIAVKKKEIKLDGKIALPATRQKIYEIGEVVTVGDTSWSTEPTQFVTKELFQPGDLVLFQIPPFVAVSGMYTIKGQQMLILHINDLIARLTDNVIKIENFKILGRHLLLLPTFRQASSVIITPDTAEQTRQENLSFSVLQTGADVVIAVTQGQEVFPDKARVNPMVIGGTEYVYVTQDMVYGALESK